MDMAIRVAYWPVVILTLGLTAFASYINPGVMIWVAWMMTLISWYAARFQSEEVRAIEGNRDGWRELFNQADKRRWQAEDLLRESQGVIEGQRIMLDKRDAQLARLRPYAEPRLFAAASTVLEVAGKGSDEEVDLALAMLAEAVAWWDALPAVERVELEQYEGGNDARPN